MEKLTTTWTAARARRAQERRLRRELAAYTSPADRMELDAIIARADEADAAQIDRIVTDLRAAA
jgi:hypothetical protein